MTHSKRLAWAFFAAMMVWMGCGGPGSFVWATQLPPDEASSDYLIAKGDVVSVLLLNQDHQDPLAAHAKVRSDGKISMPFLGEVVVAGKRPAMVVRELETGLKSFLTSPNVTVTVDEFQPTTVSILGEVSHPGSLALERDAGLLQALATAGGLTENANRDGIYVLRESPVPRRIRFTYDLLTRTPPTSTFRLRPGDVVIVE